MTGSVQAPPGGRAARGRWATIAERGGLVIFGLALSLVLLEVVLQVGAAYVRRTAYDRPNRWTGQARRILCLGDSNTYGTFTPREATYPAVLERLWNGQAGRDEVDVLNLGIPGTNSSKLRNNFRSLLASFKPEIALVLVGANDLWTTPVAAEDEKRLTLEQRLWQRSRVFRLFYMIARAVRGFTPPEEPEVIVKVGQANQAPRGVVRLGDQEFDLTWTGAAGPERRNWSRDLRDNLNAMREAAADNDVELVLLTYAADRQAYGLANSVIRAMRAPDLPVIDAAGVFTRLCPEQPCADLFFPDGHPTVRGYQVFAATVWRELARLHGRPTRPQALQTWNRALHPSIRRLLAADWAAADAPTPAIALPPAPSAPSEWTPAPTPAPAS